MISSIAAWWRKHRETASACAWASSGPPPHGSINQQCIAGNGAEWREAYPADVSEFDGFLAHGEAAHAMIGRVTREWPAMGLLSIPAGSLVGPAGWVLGQDGLLLPEFSWFGPHVSEMSLPKRWPKPKRVNGTCLSIASDWSATNYGHFLLDALPRVHLARQAGLNWSEVDHIYCPSSSPGRAAQWLGRLGVPVEKVDFEPMTPHQARRFDRLLVTSFPGVRRNYPPWTADFLRSALVPTAGEPTRRLYVTRAGGQRAPANDDEVVRVVRSFGFEVYDPAQSVEPWKDFSQASAIVGPHGAGLTDIVFCRPGTRVLELVPSDHQFPYYCTLARSGRLQYSYVLCRSTGQREANAWGPSPHDFVVDIDVLTKGLQSLIEAKR